MTTQPPLIFVPEQVQTAQGAGDQELEVAFPRNTEFYVGVAVEDTAEGAQLVFRGRDNKDGIIIPAELGVTRYKFAIDISTINLQSAGALANLTGATLSAWLVDPPSDDVCP